MTKPVLFTDLEPRYVFERDCLAFDATFPDGTPVECLVTAELLFSRFGAKDFTEEELQRSFHEHRDDIHAIARGLIEHGWIDDGRVVLTTHFTRLTVRFEEPLARDERVQTAHRILLEIIGPRAGEILVEWHTSPETPPRPSVLLRLRDPAIRREISTSFPPKVMENPEVLRLRLGTAWSAMLMARSEELILKSG